MRRPQTMDDRIAARILADGADGHDPELGAFVRDVKAAYMTPPDEVTEERHVSGMVAMAHLLADKGEPVARPASKAHGPDPQASGLPIRRRLMQGSFAKMRMRIAAGLVALVGATTALAGVGALPDPLQGMLADAASTVGIASDSSSDESVSGTEGDADFSTDTSNDGCDFDASSDGSASDADGDSDFSEDSSSSCDDDEETSTDESFNGVAEFDHSLSASTSDDECDSSRSEDESASGDDADESMDESTDCKESDSDHSTSASSGGGDSDSSHDASTSDDASSDDDESDSSSDSSVSSPGFDS